MQARYGLDSLPHWLRREALRA